MDFINHRLYPRLKQGVILLAIAMGSAMASAAPASGQLAWQVTPYGGYSSSMSFDSDEVSDLHSKEGSNWGLMIHKETRDPGVIGVIYSHQTTDLSPEISDKLTIQYLHFSGALVYPDGPLHPYVGASAGLTHMSAYDSVIKPSMSLAVGVQPRLTDNFALMAELRGYSTFFNSSSQFICDPSVCAARIQSNVIGQLQANVGMTFRF